LYRGMCPCLTSIVMSLVRLMLWL